DVKAIVEDVFNSRGFTDFEIKTQRSFKQREYTVQYRESDFHFVSRLLEEEGIFYFFKCQIFLSNNFKMVIENLLFC
ncbi:MAG: contractile injection system protein, VgrG/Pvc8 family, partial [Candidatus Lokiarchaeia archaeon]|nr:contractile injection system protein, VgrG/Pvc8 family [Candidatus Lokiarchaeia archaeon]